ncbi:hypothetical protein HDU93_002019, partial [Gonapodya sp. JEL0774]
ECTTAAHMSHIETLSQHIVALTAPRAPSAFFGMALDRLCSVAGTREFLVMFGKLAGYVEELESQMELWKKRREQAEAVGEACALEDSLMEELFDFAACGDTHSNTACAFYEYTDANDVPSEVGYDSKAPIFIDPAILEDWGLLCGTKRRWTSINPERSFSTYVSFDRDQSGRMSAMECLALAHPFTPIFTSGEDPHCIERRSANWARDPVTGLYESSTDGIEKPVLDLMKFRRPSVGRVAMPAPTEREERRRSSEQMRAINAPRNLDRALLQSVTTPARVQSYHTAEGMSLVILIGLLQATIFDVAPLLCH